MKSDDFVPWAYSAHWAEETVTVTVGVRARDREEALAMGRGRLRHLWPHRADTFTDEAADVLTTLVRP